MHGLLDKASADTCLLQVHAPSILGVLFRVHNQPGALSANGLRCEWRAGGKERVSYVQFAADDLPSEEICACHWSSI